MNKEKHCYIESILNKYKNIALTKSYYYEKIEEFANTILKISPFEVNNYFIYVNSNLDDEIKEDLKKICIKCKIFVTETDHMPISTLIAIINKRKI